MPHFACAVVADAGVDLVLRIHHKRTVADQRLIEWLTAQHQELRIFKGVEAHDVASAVVEGKLLIPEQVAALAFKLPFDDVGKGIVRGVYRQVESPPLAT